jgi:predicted Zn-dependent protease
MAPRSIPQEADAPFLSREEAKRLTDRVLSFAKADETRVTVNSGWEGNTRFAGGEITTSGGGTDTSVTVVSTIGKRRASATSNILDDDGLRRVVDVAEQLARLSPEDPELMPELGPQTYAPVNGYAGATAALGPEARALAAKKVIDASREAGKAAGDLFVAGFLDVDANALAIGNNRGLFAYHRNTNARLTVTARTPDGTGSGWAAAGVRDWATVDAAALGRRAGQKAVQSRTPVAIEPGMYTAILEPHAVAEIMGSVFGAFDARNADEGRSPFSKRGGGTRVGEKIADERITVYSDPADPDLLGRPFDGEGLPLGRTVWVENGILRNLSYSRYWAQKQGKTPNGGGGGGGFGGGGGGGAGGLGGGIKFTGGTKSVEELVAECERGILVTHFFYIRSLDARTVTLTGLTRDGLFLVEKGKVTRPIKNFRWNESPLLMLSRLEEIGRAERTSAGQVMPALRVRDFNFASTSEAV